MGDQPRLTLFPLNIIPKRYVATRSTKLALAKCSEEMGWIGFDAEGDDKDSNEPMALTLTREEWESLGRPERIMVTVQSDDG